MPWLGAASPPGLGSSLPDVLHEYTSAPYLF